MVKGKEDIFGTVVVFVWKLSENSRLFLLRKWFQWDEIVYFTEGFCTKTIASDLTDKEVKIMLRPEAKSCLPYLLWVASDGILHQLPLTWLCCFSSQFHQMSQIVLSVLTEKVTVFLESNHNVILLDGKKATKFWVITLGHVSKIRFLAYIDNKVQTPTESDRVLADLSSSRRLAVILNCHCWLRELLCLILIFGQNSAILTIVILGKSRKEDFRQDNF